MKHYTSLPSENRFDATNASLTLLFAYRSSAERNCAAVAAPAQDRSKGRRLLCNVEIKETGPDRGFVVARAFAAGAATRFSESTTHSGYKLRRWQGRQLEAMLRLDPTYSVQRADQRQ